MNVHEFDITHIDEFQRRHLHKEFMYEYDPPGHVVSQGVVRPITRFQGLHWPCMACFRTVRLSIFRLAGITS